MNINFFDLAQQKDKIGSALQKGIMNVLGHNQFILGPEVAELEHKLEKYTNSSYCITCANGTDALQIALMALDIGPGDEVITPAFTYISTVEVIRLLGATPVYVDVELRTANIQINKIEAAINEKTKAIIPVSLYGSPPNFNKINEIAYRNNVTVIEDAAQSFGASRENVMSCNLSEIACTSFFPTKPLGCYGDGGAIFTSNEKLAERMRLISRHGQKQKYLHENVGINSRLDTLQASILINKLSILDFEINQRNRNVNLYKELLLESRFIKFIIPEPDVVSAVGQFTIAVDDRERLSSLLKSRNIPFAVHYPLPIHHQPAYRRHDLKFSNAENLSTRVLSLPVHAYLDYDQIVYIASTLLDYDKY
ncbi:DegT/DnrJ/EryC1/StrS family aminotransferase [Amylibacter sp.]|nr:DegT/DnrJ/EryC1/StrS family aminotransferase [Amylibacter sp.]MDB4095659.1 DegT/DnrJ/EryC1/StrS family aminotransferase [Amylibacter sp.]